MTRNLRQAVLGAAMVLVGGCPSVSGQVRSRATSELRCNSADIEVISLGAGGYRATGCGRSVLYTCLERGVSAALCTVEHIEGRDAASAGGHATEARGTTTHVWSDEAFESLWAYTLDAVRACVAPDHPAIEVDVTVAEDGRVSHSRVVADGSPELQRCVTAAFLDVRLDGRATRPRRARLRYAPRDTTGETAGGEAAAPDPALAAFVGARIDAHRGEVLACVDAPRVGVSAAWDAAGRVSLSLRGERAGTPEEACVRAAVGEIVIDPAPGSAGVLVHPVAD